MKGAKLIYRYDHYTWPELRDLVAKQPVVVLPVGSTEDHGHHLPLDVDTFVTAAICDAAAARIPDEVLLLPELAYGFEDHHMDFPGTITISDNHLLNFVLDITKSVAHHGFRDQTHPFWRSQRGGSSQKLGRCVEPWRLGPVWTCRRYANQTSCLMRMKSKLPFTCISTPKPCKWTRPWRKQRRRCPTISGADGCAVKAAHR